MLDIQTRLALVIALLLGPPLLWGCKKRTVTSARLESPSEREALIREAFAQEPTTPVDASVDRFFVDFARAVRDEGGEVSDFVDVAAMGRNMEKLGLIDTSVRLRLESPRSRRQIAQRVFASPEAHWHTHEIRQTITLASGESASGARVPKEVIAMVIHRHVEDGRRLMRWWLIRSELGSWRVYDFEYINDGIRYSQHLALALMADKSKEPWLEHAARLNRDLVPALSAMDLEAARRAVEQIDASLLPAIWRRQFLNYKATLELSEMNFEGSLATARSAREVDPGLGETMTSLTLEMTALRLLDRYEESIAVAQKGIDLFGPDEDVLSGIGEAHLKLDKPEAAAKAFRAGLVANADCADCLEGLIRTRLADTEELAGHLGKMNRLDADLETMRTSFVESEDRDALSELIGALSTLKPEHAGLPRLRADLASLETPPSPID